VIPIAPFFVCLLLFVYKELIMKKTGVWIDHREAIIVELSNGRNATTRITSQIESQPRRASNNPSGPFDSLQAPSDPALERKKQAELGQFYDVVISHLTDVGDLFVFGPGEAKVEFRKRIIQSGQLPESSCTVETCDSMTEPQIVAKVVEYFAAGKS
jgi:hypothetical protein